MSLSEFSKNHGSSIAGAGLFALACSVAFVGNGMFKRFDEVQTISAEARSTILEAKKTVADVRAAQEAFAKDMVALRAQFPSLGKETGEAAATAADAFKNAMCKDGQKCEKAEAVGSVIRKMRGKAEPTP